MALGIIAAVTVALAFIACLLVTQDRSSQHTDDRNRHVFRGQGEAVTVAELLADAKERGDPTQLTWTPDDEDKAALIRPYVQDQFPTAQLPRIEDPTSQNPKIEPLLPGGNDDPDREAQAHQWRGARPAESAAAPEVRARGEHPHVG